MSDPIIRAGARQAVINCVRIQPDENAVIITDRATQKLAQALAQEVEAAQARATLYLMEDFGPRTPDGKDPLDFPEMLVEALADAQVSFYIAQCFAGELASFRMPMIEVIERYRLRHAHMPGFTAQMMGEGMAADYAQIQDLSRKVYEIVHQSSEIHVTTGAGTDLVARFDPQLKWIISDGRITPDHWTNLPDGEVFTAPATADGCVVVDGCFGDFFTEKYGLIEETPLSYTLQDGRALKESVECENDALKKDFLIYTFNTDEHSHRLGEFAIGTNIGLKQLIGNLLQDEKYPGIHLALGNPYPTKTGATWQSQAHNDGILKNPTIKVDGQVIMEEGTFLI